MVNLMTDSPFMVARILADLYAFNQEPVSKCKVNNSYDCSQLGRGRKSDASFIRATPPPPPAVAAAASRSSLASASLHQQQKQKQQSQPLDQSPSSLLLISSEQTQHKEQNEASSAKSYSMKRKKASDENTRVSKVAEAASLDVQGASRDAVVSAAKRSSERQKQRQLKHHQITTPSKRNTCGPTTNDHNTTQVVKAGRTSRHACSFPGCHKVYGEYRLSSFTLLNH